MPLFMLLLPVVTVMALFAGWVNNVIWTFHQANHFTNLILGIFSTLVAPIGALHGLYLFF